MKHLCTNCKEKLRVEDYSEVDIDDDFDFCLTSRVTCDCGKKYTFYLYYEPKLKFIEALDEEGEVLDGIEEEN